MNDWNEEKAVTELQEWARVDASVYLTAESLLTALRDDNALPSKEDCELLVSGDQNGTIPPELIARYPNLHALLDAELT